MCCHLAATILISAYRDLESKSEVLKDKAEYFFIAGRFKFWADAAHLDHAVVMEGYRNVLARGFPTGDKRYDRYRREGA